MTHKYCYKKIEEKKITVELAEMYINNATERYKKSDLQEHSQGSTYVRFEDMIRIHLFESSSSQQICIVDDRPNCRNKEVQVRRSWPITINILHTEDKHRYGSQFRSIPKFQTGDNASMLTWILFSILFSILSSCSDLWTIVDTKSTPFKWSGWEVWVLTSI